MKEQNLEDGIEWLAHSIIRIVKKSMVECWIKKREYIKETGQVPERMLIPDKISAVESLLKEDYKSGADKSKEERKSIVENQEKEINNLVTAISKIKNVKAKRIMTIKLNDMLNKRQKDYAIIRKGLGYKFKSPEALVSDEWMEDATE